jgi:hypothetical protein
MVYVVEIASYVKILVRIPSIRKTDKDVEAILPQLSDLRNIYLYY